MSQLGDFRASHKGTERGLVAVVAVLVVAVVVWALWRLRGIANPLAKTAADVAGTASDTAANARRAAKDITDGLANTTSGLPRLGNVVGAFAAPTNAPANPDYSQNAVARRDLRVEIVGDVAHAPGWDFVHTERRASVRVVDVQAGQPVAATIHMRPRFAPVAAIYGTQDQWFPGSGTVTFDLSTADVPVVSGESSFDLWADSPGYNTSPVTAVD